MSEPGNLAEIGQRLEQRFGVNRSLLMSVGLACVLLGVIAMALQLPWGARNLKPGPNGSRCHTGDRIVLGCGHTWGYTAYWDSGDPTGCRAPDTTHGTPGRGPARASLGQRRSP